VKAHKLQALQSGALSVLILVVLLLVWHLATLPVKSAAVPVVPMTAEQIEYQKLLGKDPGAAEGEKKNSGFPTLAQMGETVVKNLSSPFYDNGPNDKGIGIQLGHSLGRVGLGFGIAALVAHDWGGAIAWNLAAQEPALLQRLVILNAPHPLIFARELTQSPAQQAASAYMNFLCRPGAEALLAENDFAGLWPFFDRMGGHAWLDEGLRARYRAVWAMGLTGGLNLYRASPLRPPSLPSVRHARRCSTRPPAGFAWISTWPTARGRPCWRRIWRPWGSNPGCPPTVKP
jgi:hypothetical protein